MARVLAVVNILLTSEGRMIQAGQELPPGKHVERLIAQGQAREEGKAAKATPEASSTKDLVILGDEARQIVKAKPTGVWTYHPASLAGKKLDALNAMVHAIDPSMAPFKTVREAVAQLSSETGE